MENNPKYIKAARKLFQNYGRMKMEIMQLDNSINYMQKNIEANVDSDIHSASVSHGSGGAIGSFSNCSTDKIPQIVENIDKIRKQYESSIYDLTNRKNLLESAVKSIDIFVSSLEWTDKTLMKRHYMEEQKKSYDEISAETYNTAETLRKRERKILNNYIKTVHIDVLIISQML